MTTLVGRCFNIRPPFTTIPLNLVIKLILISTHHHFLYYLPLYSYIIPNSINLFILSTLTLKI
jgi:hypothetical protein